VDIDPTLLTTVASVGLGIVVGSGGIVAYKYQQAKVALRQMAEFLTAASDSLEDDTITEEERVICTKEWREFVSAAKALFSL